MFFNRQTFTVWRSTTGAGLSATTWSSVATIIGTLMPLSGTDDILNNQEFADVKHIIIAKLIYQGNVQQDDEIKTSGGNLYRVRAVHVHNNVLPHIAIYLGDTQWNRS